ncbi:hypothetical protein C2G38_2118384 [Gigaspora rosea]|uniref:Uncharacterized protein n=1 Tax=Gigaspora rosea TaxID=44941 RepID=A0A397U5B8_9GLOM|nr:hypothetical protein C2G38_2118384 [Gigaspora rosea]
MYVYIFLIFSPLFRLIFLFLFLYSIHNFFFYTSFHTFFSVMTTCLMVLRRRKSTVEFSRSCVHADSQFFSYFFFFSA